MSRTTLPQRRATETFEIAAGKDLWRVSVGFYGDHSTVGEVFVSGSKCGTDMEALARDGAILLSLALQHGVPIETMRGALTKDSDGAASTLIGKVADLLAVENQAEQPARTVDQRFPKLSGAIRELLAKEG